jgi:CheY-like chemotaxis protein
MSSRYSQLHVLIVDDFNSFRLTLSKILYDMGFRKVDSVGSSEKALNFCLKNHYDLILSDYNLGQGKNGQQFLEELRVNDRLKPQDIFILLSAETSRNVVMSAYDCEPDAYLTKPITTKVIDQRLKRLMSKRVEMLDIYTALANKNKQDAISQLEKKITEETRYGMDCQKLLADLYIQNGQLEKAEKIYRTVLEMRALDWAQVGLADAKIKSGEPAKAVEWLNKIISENPSCMKAYDVLSLALKDLNDQKNLQKNLERAVEISPMSLGRQVSLARVAMENGNAEVAAKAYRQTMKYGANSCHDTTENKLNYVKSVARFYDQDAIKAAEMSNNAIEVLSTLESKNIDDFEMKIKTQLLGSQIWGLKGESQKSKNLLDVVVDLLDNGDSTNIEIKIEMVNALTANKKFAEADREIKQLITDYSNDQSSLEKIDPLLQEPVSERGKKLLAKANKKGIDAYKNKKYDVAVDYFSKVESRYPRYLGVKLNLVQTLIAKIQGEGSDGESKARCTSILKTVERTMTPDNSQFNRYRQLQEMLRSRVENK